jgi:hypothetical protein
MPRPQFTIRALLVAMLVVAAFFAGIRFERERQRRADERAAALAPKATVTQGTLTTIDINEKSGEVIDRKVEWSPPSQVQRGGQD